jgi:hypothetical protein
MMARSIKWFGYTVAISGLCATSLVRRAVERRPVAPNRTFRSRHTSPERSSFKPARLRVALNPLSLRASYIRTKTGVVRLCQRKKPERASKRPKMGFRAGVRGSDNWRESPAFCGVPAGAEARKKNVANG